jgi:hypothetical protein
MGEVEEGSVLTATISTISGHLRTFGEGALPFPINHSLFIAVPWPFNALETQK